jgi:anti-sigma regulatory factor (Ser/Thr protein kinase)
MRAALGTFLEGRGVGGRVKREVVLAAEEALTNAIIHAGDVYGEIRVAASVLDGAVRVEVRDGGCGFDARRVDLTRRPDNRRPRGRGLYLIGRLMDHVDIRSGAGGTCVCMVRLVH